MDRGPAREPDRGRSGPRGVARAARRGALDGTITGLDAKLTLDQGSYPAVPIPSFVYGDVVRVLLPGPYRIEGLRFEQTMVATNKPSYVPYRGPWAIETWAREALLDRIATELGLDPFEVRRRNLVGPTSSRTGWSRARPCSA